MRTIYAIVEGHGDAESIRILLTRLAAASDVHDLEVKPWRVKRHRVVKPGELEREVGLAARTSGAGDGVLVLLDADRDPVCRLGPDLAERARTARRDIQTAVVLAKMEYEAWFLASIKSLRGYRDVPADADPPDDAESIRDAKRWLGERMKRPYAPVTDQPKFSARFDLDEARKKAPSFDKLCREVARLLKSP